MALGTNGYLFKDEDLEEILSCLTYLRFNISAGEPERYAYIHGCTTQCYDKVVKTMKNAVEIRNKIGGYNWGADGVNAGLCGSNYSSYKIGKGNWC